MPVMAARDKQQIDGTARRSAQARDGPIDIRRVAGPDHRLRAGSRESAAIAKPRPEAPPITMTRVPSSDIEASVIVRLLQT